MIFQTTTYDTTRLHLPILVIFASGNLALTDVYGRDRRETSRQMGINNYNDKTPSSYDLARTLTGTCKGNINPSNSIDVPGLSIMPQQCFETIPMFRVPVQVNHGVEHPRLDGLPAFLEQPHNGAPTHSSED